MSLKKIAFIVVAFHVMLIAWGMYHTPQLDLQQKQKLVTQTVVFHEPAPAVKTVSKNEEVKSIKKEVKKQETKPKEVKKTSKSEKPKQEKRKISQEMIAKAQENIAKISKTSDKVSQKESIKIPEAMSKSVAATQGKGEVLSSQEAGYRDELANRLKLLLRLPEYGKVNMKLTLNRLGEVKKLMIESYESESNKAYVEINIPQLRFPPFGNNFSGADQYTFLVSLNNED